ncbi:MAG: TA system VapC family ribonuclease toxin [Verrucomicrobiota bacterium]|jgi:toxin-antitoxin system PIN domain toxin
MKGYLLDTNLLIALLWPSHERHDLAMKWFARHRGKGWATCPITQAGFVRIVSNPAFSRDAVQPREAVQVLRANTAARDHEFWPDELPLAAAVAFAGVRLIGHQQVTDAYLLGLALHRCGKLATLDQGIGALAELKSPERAGLETLE